MRANIRLSTLVDGANIGSLNVKNGRIGVARSTSEGPTVCGVRPSVTPSHFTAQEQQMNLSNSHRQTALGGAE